MSDRSLDLQKGVKNTRQDRFVDKHRRVYIYLLKILLTDVNILKTTKLYT